MAFESTVCPLNPEVGLYLSMGYGQENSSAAFFRRGEVVSVRSLNEILATLDRDGKLEGLPFMPEMAQFCGATFTVHRRAEKTCVEGVGMRGLRGTVFLAGLRCDGSAHGGCERRCLLFWKEAWLKRADGTVASIPATAVAGRSHENAVPGAAIK